MEIAISTWRPWNYYKASYQQRIEMYKSAGSRCCIKGVNRNGLYGIDSWSMFNLPFYKGKSNDDLERLCKANDIGVDIWCYLYLDNPAGEARAIHNAIARWNPQKVYLDVEGHAKPYAHNTGAFLRSLGRVQPKVLLQSYYSPKYHPQISWHKWLTYKADGKYIIDALSPQAYPYSNDFVTKYKRMFEQYYVLLEQAQRLNIPWLVTMATFEEHGWMPDVEAMNEGILYLESELGTNLLGLNFWRQSFLFEPKFEDILHLIYDLNSFTPPPPPVPSTLEERVEKLEMCCRNLGCNL